MKRIRLAGDASSDYNNDNDNYCNLQHRFHLTSQCPHASKETTYKSEQGDLFRPENEKQMTREWTAWTVKSDLE